MSADLVVIPVFNEEETIGAVLAELCQHYRGEVLIVDDGSTDQSLARIGCCRNYKLSVIRHESNLGYGASLIDGFRYAQGHGYSALVTMDCDAQHEPHQVPEFFAALDGSDVVSGSRYLLPLEKGQSAPADRVRLNKLMTERISAVTGYALTDAFCGFKAYRVAALERLNLDEQGYGFPLQFWIQAARAGLRVKEIPVTRIYVHLDRSFGAELDDPQRRLVYQSVIVREVAKWQRE